MSQRVLLILPSTSYKARDFMDAAQRLGVEVVVAVDRRQALEQASPGQSLTVDLVRPERGVAGILEFAQKRPFSAILGVDDETVWLAAAACEALGLRHNPPAAVSASRNKHQTRQLLRAAGLRGPAFSLVDVQADPEQWARRLNYPCVIKPLFLGAGRGVLRADDRHEFVTAFGRVISIVQGADVRSRPGDKQHLLVEDYLPGEEVTLEGLLDRGRMQTLALFDKPDPLVGPTFEETLFVTPSRLPPLVQSRVREEAQAACRALGLTEGPIHAEFRVHEGRVWTLELAARTIGGLCSRALRFGTGMALEELVLCHALGRGVAGLAREASAAGVMMIPIPGRGTLRRIHGLDEARARPGIEEVTITRHLGATLVPLPEGHQYLGFIFARATDPATVERSLRLAHSRLSFEVES